MTIQTRGCDTVCIAQDSMSRATPEATGCHHRVTNHYALLRWPLALGLQVQANKDSEKYTYFAGLSNGHNGVPLRYCAQCPMEEIFGFPRSHWMLPLGKYLLR
jgi:hypothetical protein